jgi:rRNA maturation RNase YbeY
VQISKETSVWLQNAIHNEVFELGKLQYTFLTDDDLLQINKKYLNHDTFTDIITFDYNKGKYIFSELYISLDRVQENANNNHVDFNKELHRVLIHGLLHLMGYNDKSPNEKSIMTAKEDYYLSLLPQ